MYWLTPTLVSTLILSYSVPFASAGSQTKGENCSVSDNRLQVGTYQFYTDCDTSTYCNATTSTCELKGCRIDDFPFGYVQDDPDLPPLCAAGEFCPDEEDACQPQLAVGSPCQLNRDDQCAPPPNWIQLNDNTTRGLNFNGSVCLNNVCMYANATLGSTCVVENTPYIAYGENGQESIDIVSRGNCAPGGYCDSQTTQCLAVKDIGASCSADKECSTYNCLSSGVCGKAADSPNHFGTWVYIVVAAGIAGSILGTLVGMFMLHRKQRDVEREKRVQYWREQTAFRQNIMQMRETARASILSLPQNGGGSGANSRRSTLNSRDFHQSYDSSAPIMQHAANKASGLRNHYNDDDASVDYDDGIMMQPQQHENHDAYGGYGGRF